MFSSKRNVRVKRKASEPSEPDVSEQQKIQNILNLAQSQTQPAASRKTAVTRRRTNKTIQIPGSISQLSTLGTIGATSLTSVPGLGVLGGIVGQLTSTAPKKKPIWKGLTKLIDWLDSQAGIDFIKESKINRSKIVDIPKTDANKDQDDATVKDKILPFTSDKTIDSNAVVLSPEFGSIDMIEPVVAKYPTPIHYVEAMKISTFSSSTPNILGIPSIQKPTGCDKAREAIPSLVLRTGTFVIKAVSNACDASTDLKNRIDWYKPELARGRFWLYLWLALWQKYRDDSDLAGALVNTGSKLLIFYDADTVYGDGEGTTPPIVGVNTVGFILMFIRSLMAAGWWNYPSEGPGTVPNAIFEKWIRPAIDAVYEVDSANGTLKTK